MTYNQTDIKFPPSIDQVTRELFSDQAYEAANKCTQSNNANKPAQLRRFYDELVMWHDKVFSQKTPEEQQAKFDSYEPYIQMMRAKAAYARGRALIDESFYKLIDSLINQVETPENLKTAKLFFEAFIGYMKYIEVEKKLEKHGKQNSYK